MLISVHVGYLFFSSLFLTAFLYTFVSVSLNIIRISMYLEGFCIKLNR